MSYRDGQEVPAGSRGSHYVKYISVNTAPDRNKYRSPEFQNYRLLYRILKPRPSVINHGEGKTASKEMWIKPELSILVHDTMVMWSSRILSGTVSDLLSILSGVSCCTM